MRQSLHIDLHSHTGAEREGTCCQGDKKQPEAPPYPRRVSRGDVISCRRLRVGLWPIGQKHRRAQPVFVGFFFHPFLFLIALAPFSSMECPLTHPLIFCPCSLFWLAQLGQRVAAEVWHLRSLAADKEWSWLVQPGECCAALQGRLQRVFISAQQRGIIKKLCVNPTLPKRLWIFFLCRSWNKFQFLYSEYGKSD